MATPSNTELEYLFKQTFFNSFNTLLKGGASEPVYIPVNFPKANEHVNDYLYQYTKHANVIYYRDDFFRSALHEVAHWCIAGVERRQKLDFGYWYESDGRTQDQQCEFQKVEIKPQAIEHAFCRACNIPFRVSVDNLNSTSELSEEQQREQEKRFFDAVSHQLALYEKHGFPQRAQMFIDALSAYYQLSGQSEISRRVGLSRKFKLGLCINPFAGIGGSLALKGSDGKETRDKALSLGAEQLAMKKTTLALSECLSLTSNMHIYTGANDLGQGVCEELKFEYSIVHIPQSAQTEIQDTHQLVEQLLENQVDLILFAGGDGTARNICEIVQDKCPVLGIPAGCKIHSGVYAITPQAAGKVLKKVVSGELVSINRAEVRDIDEELFRQGQVKSKHFGEMIVPHELTYIQSVKMGGKESDELLLDDISDYLLEIMEDDPDTYYVMGSGSTLNAVMQRAGLENTLLGVDLIKNGQVVANDVNAKDLLQITDNHPTKLVITIIGGQGHIFGRGNQQISPPLIKRIGKHNILLVATKAKLATLENRGLIADTGNTALDKQLAGPISVITGYKDEVLYFIQDFS